MYRRKVPRDELSSTEKTFKKIFFLPGVIWFFRFGQIFHFILFSLFLFFLISFYPGINFDFLFGTSILQHYFSTRILLQSCFYKSSVCVHSSGIQLTIYDMDQGFYTIYNLLFIIHELIFFKFTVRTHERIFQSCVFVDVHCNSCTACGCSDQ